MTAYKKIKKCRICKKKNLKLVVDLKGQYIQGSFIKKNFPSTYKKKIPLKLVLCNNCSLLQANYSVSPKLLYKNYWYSSGINHTMRNHLKILSKKSLNLLKISKISHKKINILDIGCNDGTLLKNFSNKFNKIGIDPSQISNKIKDKNIKIINDFFPSKKLLKISKKIKFNLITSIAMFYDLEDPVNFVKNIKIILSKNGIWIFELSYLLEMLRKNSYDTICHEHLEYYSLSVLTSLLKTCNLKIFKIELNQINGGSIRCYVTHVDCNIYNNKKNFSKINLFLKKEKDYKINTLKPYKDFFKRIIKIRDELNILLKKLKKNKKIVHIYGASTKGNTILQWSKIDKNLIKFAAERNKEKWNAETIGSKIKIISEKKSKGMNPDYFLVLPWHFREEFLIREKKFLNSGGKMIFPLPKLKIY